MTRIVLNPTQLGQTASELDNAAGEYQAIGAQVCGCDCGCMPADVAAVVDSVTTDIRSSLQGFSFELGTQASDLSQRAGVTQDGGFTAVSAAYGGGSDDVSVVSGGGFDSFGLGGGSDDVSVVTGGGFGSFGLGGGSDDVSVVSGGGFDSFGLGSGSGDVSVVTGGGFDSFGLGSGDELVGVNVGDSAVLDLLADPYYAPGIGRISEWGYGDPILITPGGYGPTPGGELSTMLNTIHLFGNVSINTAPSLFPNPHAWNPYASPYS
jgi:hypothetical protein